MWGQPPSAVQRPRCIRHSTTLPEYLSTLSPLELSTAKSHLLNIFRANPWLSRFYAGCLQITDSNPCQINNLPTRSVNFFNLNSKGSNSMPLNTNIRVCTHIKVNGVPCGSSALRREVFWYFHQRMIRGVPTPTKSRLHPIAFIESEEGIQAALGVMEIINALVRNTIDFRRAQLVLRALHIAVRNSPRVHFDLYKQEMIHEVPNYPAAPTAQKPPSPALAQAGALARIPRPKPVRITPPPPPPIVAVSRSVARPKPPARAIPVAPSRNAARRRSG
jgi:hypothetical protein